MCMYFPPTAVCCCLLWLAGQYTSVSISNERQRCLVALIPMYLCQPIGVLSILRAREHMHCWITCFILYTCMFHCQRWSRIKTFRVKLEAWGYSVHSVSCLKQGWIIDESNCCSTHNQEFFSSKHWVCCFYKCLSTLVLNYINLHHPCLLCRNNYHASQHSQGFFPLLKLLQVAK